MSAESAVERTLAAQALLAGIAERGADAVGYASRESERPVSVTKLRGGASALLDEISVPHSEWQVYRLLDVPRGAWTAFQYLVRERLREDGVDVRPDGTLGSGNHV